MPLPILIDIPSRRTLLDYLDEKDVSATFFVVGSRVIERPNIVIEEYMKGHEISVHTWSHRVSCLLAYWFFFVDNIFSLSLL